MGWVSTSEDIEELRQERLRFLKGYDSLTAGLRKISNLSDAKRAEADIDRLVSTLIQAVDERRKATQLAYDKCEKLMSDTNFRYAKRLEKKSDQLEELRSKFSQANASLARCRARREQLMIERDKLAMENAELRAQLSDLKDNDLAWQSEIKSVKRIY